MTREEVFFIQVLSDHLNEKKTDAVMDIDWESVLRLADQHELEGILFYQSKDFMPADLSAGLEESFVTTLFYYINRRELMGKISWAFHQRGIPCFIIKGMNVARYYPQPALRTMGDCDLIVHETDRDTAEEILLNLGLSRKYEFTGKERAFTLNYMDIELHHRLIYDEVITLPVQRDFFNSCWDYIRDGEPDHSFEFLFLLVHLRKHMLNEGAGLRQFMDIAAAVKNDCTLDWDWIAGRLPELKLDRFAQTCFGMVDHWFGIRAPLYYEIPDPDFRDRATTKILGNGVFGFNDRSNKMNAVANERRAFRGPDWLFRLTTMIARSFPGYNYLRIGEPYRFLDGRPWMLPAAWIYRFYLMHRGRTTSGTEIMGRIMVGKDILDARERDLLQWGLIDRDGI